jgi:hypothetical protein
LLKLLRERLCPNRSTDRTTYSATNTAYDEQEDKYHSNVLVVDRRENGKLHAKNKTTSSDRENKISK